MKSIANAGVGDRHRPFSVIGIVLPAQGAVARRPHRAGATAGGVPPPAVRDRPPPRRYLVRYAGCSLRQQGARETPRAGTRAPRRATARRGDAERLDACGPVPWAELLRRVFAPACLSYPLLMIQSDRLFAALQGLGGHVRYVSLPAEAHGYRARESALHVLWEQVRWLDAYVKNARPRPAARLTTR